MSSDGNDPLSSLREELDALEADGLGRHLRHLRGPQGVEVTIDGQRALNFCSNNYLGLANHPALVEAATRAMESEGLGAGASRLIGGTLSCHDALEASLAESKQTEAALLFNSGYHANVGVLSALAGPDDLILSDALNHASIIDGARLGRAKVSVYPHLDLEGLERALATAGPYRRRFVVSESVFSMDGDVAPVAEIAALARRYGALSIIDEAHAVGVLGPGGLGLSVGAGVDVQIGTFGKALGSFGAYVAAAAPVVSLLRNRARSFVFTTALPVPVVAAAHRALTLVASSEGEALRRRLDVAATRLHDGLVRLGLRASTFAPSHIIPVVIGDANRTMAASAALLEAGFFVQGIRPPTVAANTSRLRIGLSALHSSAHIDALLQALGRLAPEGMDRAAAPSQAISPASPSASPSAEPLR